MSQFAHQAAQIDTDALARYLTAAVPGFRGPVAAEKTPTGQSNPTFLLSSPSGRYVLRKKPPGQLLKSAHAVEREYRVMKGLEHSEVPVPRMLLLCEDESVLGTPFFVMEYVDGIVFWDPALPELSKAQRRPTGRRRPSLKTCFSVPSERLWRMATGGVFWSKV